MENEKLQQLVNRWETTKLLEGMHEDKKADLALVLENQRKFNESNFDSLSPRFLRLSIPIVRRVLGGTSFDFNSSFDGEFGDITLTTIPFDKDIPSINSKELLDAEAAYCAVLCSELVGWLANWCTQNNTKCFNIKAFGVQDGRIAIYGLEK